MANLFLLAWEVAPKPLAQVQKTYDLGIVLTGITHNRKSPQDRVHLKDGADRIMHALWLYQKGKIKKILITGGNIDLNGKVHQSEARALQALLHLCQVPPQNILIEEMARNTRENALFTQKIVAEKFPNASLLLITSGFHMRRAAACFRKAGLRVDTFSAGFFTEDLYEFSFRSFLPSERAFYIWQVFLHELAGFLIYKLVGYA
ncbi:MAG: YdcF family protein [Microscillaceae bacterium]|nr:YdcF family protein [Microscillaceae bacterium]